MPRTTKTRTALPVLLAPCAISAAPLRQPGHCVRGPRPAAGATCRSVSAVGTTPQCTPATLHVLLTSASHRVFAGPRACGAAPAADWHPHSYLYGNALTVLSSDVFAKNTALKKLCVARCCCWSLSFTKKKQHAHRATRVVAPCAASAAPLHQRGRCVRGPRLAASATCPSASAVETMPQCTPALLHMLLTAGPWPPWCSLTICPPSPARVPHLACT